MHVGNVKTTPTLLMTGGELRSRRTPIPQSEEFYRHSNTAAAFRNIFFRVLRSVTYC